MIANYTSQIVWKFETLGEVKSSPCNGPHSTVFVGSHDSHLYCLDYKVCVSLLGMSRTLGPVREMPVLAGPAGFRVKKRSVFHALKVCKCALRPPWSDINKSNISL